MGIFHFELYSLGNYCYQWVELHMDFFLPFSFWSRSPPSMWPYVFRLFLYRPPDAGITGVPHIWLWFQFYAFVFFSFWRQGLTMQICLSWNSLCRPRWSWTYRDLAAFASEHWDQGCVPTLPTPYVEVFNWSWNEFMYSIRFVFFLWCAVCRFPTPF